MVACASCGGCCAHCGASCGAIGGGAGLGFGGAFGGVGMGGFNGLGGFGFLPFFGLSRRHSASASDEGQTPVDCDALVDHNNPGHQAAIQTISHVDDEKHEKILQWLKDELHKTKT